jgi:Suppressor of fused protein (SUFU)
MPHSQQHESTEENADGTSGYGFELTFRLPIQRRKPAMKDMSWVCAFLHNLAKYVFETDNSFSHGHYYDSQSPINLSSASCNITFVAFHEDPILKSIRTVNGDVTFLQVGDRLLSDPITPERGARRVQERGARREERDESSKEMREWRVKSGERRAEREWSRGERVESGERA